MKSCKINRKVFGVRSGLLLLAGVLLTGGGLRAQPSGQVGVVLGQFTGPYYYDFTEGGAFPETSEIAHGVVLPPPAGEPNLERILVWNRIQTPNGMCVGSPQSCVPVVPAGTYGRTFAINANRTTGFTKVAVNDALYDSDTGSDSLFCGGQAFLPDGSLVLFGGTDRPQECQQNDCQSGLGVPSVGSRLVLRLDTSVNPPAWSPILTSDEMPKEHWYPNGITLEDGTILVAGHTGLPVDYDKFREVITYNATQQTFDVISAVNKQRPTLPGGGYDCLTSNEADLLLGDYPRMHLLMSGDVMQSMGDEKTPVDRPVTRFFDRALPYICSGPAEENGWYEGAVEPAAIRHGGNSLHFITLDPFNPGEHIETIYAVGGGRVHDESACDETYATTGSVEKMVSPAPSSPWQMVANLNFPRMNHNTVILLDGSMLVLGGESSPTMGQGVCEPVLMAERHRTEEVFHVPNPGWMSMVPQSVGRAYHSADGLLPDGRVFLAGGVGANGPQGSQHTLEYYSPPYTYVLRPEIKTTPTGIQDWGTQFPINIKQAGSGPLAQIERVALLRPSAATHAWDSSQRYIELEFEDQGGSWEDRDLVLTIPAKHPAGAGDYMIPPGFYLLTVVDRQHSPSPAVWIQIGNV